MPPPTPDERTAGRHEHLDIDRAIRRRSDRSVLPPRDRRVPPAVRTRHLEDRIAARPSSSRKELPLQHYFDLRKGPAQVRIEWFWTVLPRISNHPGRAFALTKSSPQKNRQ